MASRIGIAGDANTGKSYSRKTLTHGEEVFLLQPSVKRNYLTRSDGKNVENFIYRPSKYPNLKEWEEVYELPIFKSAGLTLTSPTQAIKYMDSFFSQKAASEGKDFIAKNLTSSTLIGNVQLINHELKDAAIWLRFISRWMPWIKVVIVADFTHFISNVISDTSFINRKIGGEAFNRFWELAADALTTFILSTDNLRKDLIVVTEFHTEWDKERQRYELFMPAGNMLKEKFKPESYFDVLLFTDVKTDQLPNGTEKNEYRFVTRRSALYPQARASDLFTEQYIPNDLQSVITEYRNVVMS